MNLNEKDIRQAIVGYMKKYKKKNYEMAEICGMSSPSMFSQYHSGITKTLRAEYLLNFLFNSKIEIQKFLVENFVKQDTSSEDAELYKVQVNDPNNKIYQLPGLYRKTKRY